MRRKLMCNKKMSLKVSVCHLASRNLQTFPFIHFIINIKALFKINQYFCEVFSPQNLGNQLFEAEQNASDTSL